MWLDKAQTWELSDELGVLDYIRHNTLTCYNGVIGDGCGECPACQLRQRGLQHYLEIKERIKMIQQLYPSVAHPIVLNLIKILIFSRALHSK